MSNLCVQCGSSLTANTSRCGYCGTRQPGASSPNAPLPPMVADDRQRVGPSTTPPARVVVFATAGLMVVGTAVAAFVLAAPNQEPKLVAQQPAVVTSPPTPRREQPPAPAPVATPEAAVTPEPVATPEPAIAPEPVAVPPKGAAPAPAPRAATNEEWLHQLFKAKHHVLQACVEQDLRLHPNAPKRYMVTLTFEADGLPVNSFTQLTPKGSHAVWDCLRMAIFHAINDEGTHNRALPQRGNFTIALPLDFSGAKPATKAAPGFGED